MNLHNIKHRIHEPISKLSSIWQIIQHKFKNNELSLELSRGGKKTPYLMEFRKRKMNNEEDPLCSYKNCKTKLSNLQNVELQGAKTNFFY